MRSHNGMRPQDIAILIKIVARDKTEGNWNLSVLSTELAISLSEISESLNRSKLAGLIDSTKKRVNRNNLYEFIEHGLKYVFPQKEHIVFGVRGVPTALTHPFMQELFHEPVAYVWPYEKGDQIGLPIEPLYKNQPFAALNDDQFYKMMALIDIVRLLGRVREKQTALKELKRLIVNEPSY